MDRTSPEWTKELLAMAIYLGSNFPRGQIVGIKKNKRKTSKDSCDEELPEIPLLIFISTCGGLKTPEQVTSNSGMLSETRYLWIKNLAGVAIISGSIGNEYMYTWLLDEDSRSSLCLFE
ncbi:hypothetical protein ABEB36_000544 [Hypothenemus hampei]|uniref:Uncharacterized protein n=1 Tax=Hypothenemus hampei TaxID=57062 RepID=A0ABD1FBK3_HYPHA